MTVLALLTVLAGLESTLPVALLLLVLQNTAQ